MIFGRSKSNLVTPLAMLLLVVSPLLILAFTLQKHAFAGRRESITIGWKRPVKLPVGLAMSPGGRSFGSVDKEGNVCLYDRAGHLLWKREVEGASDMMIARNGQSVLVFSRLDPTHQDIYFFRRDGRRLWKHRVEGSVWSASVSPDGAYAAVTTGERYVYVYMPDPNRPKYRRWRLDGIGHCITFTPDSRRVVIGTWQESGLVCFDLKGKFQWRNEHNGERQYELQTSADGRRILGVIPGTQHTPKIELCLWDSDGKLLWKRVLDGFDGRAQISARSQYMAISYANFASEENSDIIERKVMVYKATGDTLWEKGGLFFGPRLVALSPKGSSVIVSDGERSLYDIDGRGRILSKMALGGTIRRAMCSENGHKVLVYCGDGWLYLLNVR